MQLFSSCTSTKNMYHQVRVNMLEVCYHAEHNMSIGQLQVFGSGSRNITQESVNLPKLGKSDQAAANHATNFEPAIYDVWKQQDVANAIRIPQQTVSDRFTEFGQLSNLGKSDQAAAEHATDFDLPIYNIWKQQEKTAAGESLVSHRLQ
jgi:hypothetical protein